MRDIGEKVGFKLVELDQLRFHLLAPGNITHGGNLAGSAVGINERRGNYLVSPAVGEIIFPALGASFQNRGQLTNLVAGAIKAWKMLIAGRADTFPKFAHHGRIHEPYLIVGADNENPVVHPFQDTEEFIPILLYQLLQVTTPLHLFQFSGDIPGDMLKSHRLTVNPHHAGSQLQYRYISFFTDDSLL